MEGGLSSKSLLCWRFVESFEAVRLLENCACITCARLKLHSRELLLLKDTSGNKWNRHANLLKASLKETLLPETRMSNFSYARDNVT